MPRFVSRSTGVKVDVADAKVSRMGSDWAPLAAVDEARPVWSGRKVDELRAEIARRNETRGEDDQLPANGVKADLVAALEADDEA